MKTISIGIDFSKKTFDVTILHRQEDTFIEVGYSKFDNDEKGFKAFISWVKKSVRHIKGGARRSQWIFCGENTGICSADISDWLAEAGYDMWLETALEIHMRSGISRTKNDKADSKRIAEYALRFYKDGISLHEPDSKSYKELKALYVAHDMLTRDKVTKINQVKSGTLNHSKEALRIIREQLEMINKQLRLIDQQMESLAKECEEFARNYEILTSFKGLGCITAVCLIVKTHNFKYMNDPRKLGNYMGIVPSQKKQSGTSVDTPARVSRYRDAKSNSTISQCANISIRFNPVIKAYYERLLTRGLHPNKAKNNVKFKIINIVMVMIRTDAVFDINKYGKAAKEWGKAV
ncbi:MAG: transposase [Muribaculaceae bacterium]|nr:transposase [Muribaculaceae bacterium]